MKTTLLRLAGLFLILGSLALAAPAPSGFTAKEMAQGYRDHAVLAKPRVGHRATVDADETREGLRLRRKFERFGDLRVIDLPAADTVSGAIARLRATGRYEYVEPDRLIHATAAPNDPSFAGQQWSLNNTGTNGPGGGTAGADIRAVAGWNTRTSAASVVVGVVDSGARLTHEDLAANLWTNTSGGNHGISATSGTGTTTNTTPNDTDVGHGTHVSGIIGAVGNNAKGISGIAWNVQLMELRFLHGTDGIGSTSDCVACIDYAIAHGAKVINASYGSDGYSSAEFDAISSARDADIVFVAAAGNDTLNVDTGAAYPAGYLLDNISVAASTNTDDLATYSNYGAGSVDLAAPGSDIYSTYNSSDTSYATLSGTSMAAPHVSGTVALLRAQFPSESYRQIINRLLRSVTPVAGLSGKVQTGGRLNLANALTSTSNAPFNDNFASRATLGGANISIRSSNAGASEETGEPAHAGVATTASLWWSWTAPSTTTAFFDTTGSSYETALAIYTGTALNGLTPVASDPTTGRITISVTAGTTYQIAVACKSGTPGLTLLAIGSIPVNDSFANAQAVTGTNVSVTGTTTSASKESGEPDPTAGTVSGYPAGYAAGHTVWYSWVAPASGHYALYAYSAVGADMVAGIYTGSSVSALTKIAFDDDAATQINGGTYDGAVNSNSLVPFTATAGTTYYFQVDTTNVNPTGGDFTLTLTAPAWQFAAYGGIVSSAAVGSDGTIYFGAGTTITDQMIDNDVYPENNVYALNPNGTKKWSYTTGSPVDQASPAIGSDGTVYIGSGDMKLYALNGSTGALKWTYLATTAIASSPAVATDGTVYFRDDTTLYALTSGGVKKWSVALSGGTYASPAVAADGTIYVGATGGTFYAVNPDGTQKWKFTTANGDIYTSPAIAPDGTVYFGTLNGYFYAVTPAGTQKWVWSIAGSSITSSPVLAPDGTIYFGAYDHKLHALSSAGIEKWSYTMGDEVRAASPAVGTDGTVYLPDYDGQVYAISASGTLVRTYATAALMRSAPVIANGLLCFGSSDGLFYAFNLDPVADQGPANSAWPLFQHNVLRDGRYSANFIDITASPYTQSDAAGSSVTLSVAATGPGTLSYQWSKDGTAITGATGPTYTLGSAQVADSGSYTVSVTSSTGASAVSSAAVVTIVNAIPAPGHLINLSVRTGAGTGDSTLIAGFVIGGNGTSGTKPLLIRADGPSISQYFSGTLADPALDIIPLGSNTPIASNDNWGGDPELMAIASAVGAQPLSSTSSLDSALYLNLGNGNYTANVTGVNNTTGIALAEIYDATGGAYTAATPRLINVSARAQVGTGNNVLIAGFVIDGTTPCTVLVRAVGPSISQYVSGALADPQLEIDQIVNGASVFVKSNDNWGGDAQIKAAIATTGAFTLNSDSTKDAAILITLPPGVYTATASGVGGTTGIALIEVYEVP